MGTPIGEILPQQTLFQQLDNKIIYSTRAFQMAIELSLSHLLQPVLNYTIKKPILRGLFLRLMSYWSQPIFLLVRRGK